jgi:hypothetical protein
MLNNPEIISLGAEVESLAGRDARVARFFSLQNGKKTPNHQTIYAMAIKHTKRL